MTDWELVIVDDGSRDGTPEVISAYRSRDGRIRSVRQENAGPSAARNLAIQHARAPYLALLDADDIYLSERLAVTVHVLETNSEVDLVHGGVTLIDAQGATIGPPEPYPGKPSGDIVRDLYTRRTHIRCPTATFRRSALDKVGLFDERLRATEDRDLWVRLAEQGSVAYVDRVLALYRRVAGSNSSNADRMMNSQIAFVEKHRGRRGCGPLARRQALGLIHKERGDQYNLAGQRRLARQQYMRSFAYDPTAIASLYMLVKSLIFSPQASADAG